MCGALIIKLEPSFTWSHNVPLYSLNMKVAVGVDFKHKRWWLESVLTFLAFCCLPPDLSFFVLKIRKMIVLTLGNNYIYKMLNSF